MTFLNPLILFGLIAGAIPILIHLLNKRKLPTIEFSTLSFLKELQKNKIRKIKIKQWLLLLLRTLLILFLVLAFSRPALKGTIGIAGSHSKTTVVIILDNTASMDLHNEKGKFLAQAQSKAIELLNILQEGDDAIFLRLADIPNATIEQPTHDKQTLLKLVQETTISFRQNTIDDAMRLASRLIQQSKNLNKEIYIFTDGQKSSFVNESGNKQREKLFSEQIKIFVLPLSEKKFENAGIENVLIPPSILQANKTVSISVTVKNYGDSPVKNHLISLTIDNKRVAQKSFSLASQQSSVVEMNFTPSHSGFIRGTIELEEDEISIDNARYFSLFIPENITAVIISPDETHSRYIKTGLSLFQQQNSFSLTAVTPAQASNTIIENADVLILSGVKELPQTQQSYTARFLQRGGGILFFPNSDTAYASYNNILPQFVFKGVIEKNISADDFGLTFSTVDYEFPIFRSIFEESKNSKKTPMESPSVKINLHSKLQHQQRAIISLSNGAPFLWEEKIYKGTLLAFSVPAVTSWSDFPLCGIFLPMLHQAILYLSSNQSVTTLVEKARVGNTFEFTENEFRKSKKLISSPITIFDPENRETMLRSFRKENFYGNSSAVFQFSSAVIPGFYSVVSERDTILQIPVNIENNESYPALITSSEIVNSLAASGILNESIVILNNSDSLETNVLQSRFGVELWKYFLLLAAVIAIIELIAARVPKQQHE